MDGLVSLYEAQMVVKESLKIQGFAYRSIITDRTCSDMDEMHSRNEQISREITDVMKKLKADDFIDLRMTQEEYEKIFVKTIQKCMEIVEETLTI